MRVEHGLVDARVGALGALERLGTEVVSHVVLEMVLVFSHERALGAATNSHTYLFQCIYFLQILSTITLRKQSMFII